MAALCLYLRNWLRAEEGQDLIEYALLVGLIAVVALAGVSLAGVNVSTLFSGVASQIPTGGG